MAQTESSQEPTSEVSPSERVPQESYRFEKADIGSKQCRHMRFHKGFRIVIVALVALVFGVIGGVAAFFASPRLAHYAWFRNLSKQAPLTVNQNPSVSLPADVAGSDDDMVTSVVTKVNPSVVSIVISKDVPNIQRLMPFGFPFFMPFGSDGQGLQQQQPQQQQGGSTKQTIGAGSGFLISADGLIATNKHVVADTSADYTVITSDDKEHVAKVIARDPSRDIAILKIDDSTYPWLELGDSDAIKVGQTVIAIGNSLGEFSNTVSKGIVSGLQRDLTASSGMGQSERLTNIIQTDAAINPGNSGGPLLDLSGKVIGINVAIAEGAQNIGFALPANQVKKIIDQVQTTGKISTPFLGVRYVIVDDQVQKDNNLPFNYGAIIARGAKQTDFAVIPGSPADQVGLVENDIILEVDGKKIDATHALSDILADYNVNDTITLKVWHKGETKDVTIKLGERK